MHSAQYRDHRLSATAKGIPPGLRGLPISDVGALGLNLLRDPIPTPFAVIKDAEMQSNLDLMARYTTALGVDLAPHGKTTMSPDIFERQLNSGAWAITCATGAHLRLYREVGVPRIIMANQMLDPEDIRFVAGEIASDPDFDFYAIVDSLDGVDRFVGALEERAPPRPIALLVEIGATGGRTGARSAKDALEIVHAIKRQPDLLRFAGIEAYEGIFPKAPKDAEANVAALLAQVTDFAVQCDQSGLIDTEAFILSAGGSGYFDMVIRALKSVVLSRPAHVVIRSGCYVTHDHGFYALAVERLKERPDSTGLTSQMFSPALEIWAAVQSRPEEGLALLTVGKRDISFDLGLPIALRHVSRATGLVADIRGKAEIVGLNDHHGYLRIEDVPNLTVGDLVCMGISHPCTTFDRWRYLYLVNSQYDVLGAVRTCFDG